MYATGCVARRHLDGVLQRNAPPGVAQPTHVRARGCSIVHGLLPMRVSHLIVHCQSFALVDWLAALIDP